MKYRKLVIWIAAALIAAAAHLAVARAAHAWPIVISDPYGGNHNPAVTCCSGDVIGALGGFDVRSLTFSTVSAAAIAGTIRFNYNFGDATLADYAFDPAHPSGSTMRVGDLLFSKGGTYAYGMPLVNHDGLLAGNLYQISAVMTSNQFGLNPARYVWRFGAPVRIDTAGASLLGAGTATTANLGFYEVATSFEFAPGGAFYSDFTGGSLSARFASAICGNDVVEGQIPAVPEPPSGALLAVGAALLTLWRYALKPAPCRKR